MLDLLFARMGFPKHQPRLCLVGTSLSENGLHADANEDNKGAREEVARGQKARREESHSLGCREMCKRQDNHYAMEHPHNASS